VLDGQGQVIELLRADEARALVTSGAIAGGMIPKVQAALTAAAGGTRTVVLDGRQPHALREALAGGLAGQRGTGTLIG